jgi:hypothetical protein
MGVIVIFTGNVVVLFISEADLTSMTILLYFILSKNDDSFARKKKLKWEILLKIVSLLTMS